MSNIRVKSFIPEETTDKLIELLYKEGLSDSVKINLTSNPRKKDLGFTLSVIPKNSYYTNNCHDTNENFDRIFPELADNKLSYENFLKVLKESGIVEFAKSRNLVYLYPESTDAYLSVSFEPEVENHGFKKGYSPTEKEIESMDECHRSYVIETHYNNIALGKGVTRAH